MRRWVPGRWLPWHRIPQGHLEEYNLANVKSRRVEGNHWKITLGPEYPYTYDFYGTDDQLKAEVAKRDAEVQEARRQAVKAWRAKQALNRVHEDGRHVGSLADCPRCKKFLLRLGGQL